jgi:hypothetical protein
LEFSAYFEYCLVLVRHGGLEFGNFHHNSSNTNDFKQRIGGEVINGEIPYLNMGIYPTFESQTAAWFTPVSHRENQQAEALRLHLAA